MISKEAVVEMYQTARSYSEVARAFGVSRQRIHQIVKNYSTVKRNLYKKNIQEICRICKNRSAKYLHHVDGNSSNNTQQNLLSVCGVCHTKIHSLKKTSIERTCNVCKRLFKFKYSTKRNSDKIYVCGGCVVYSQNKTHNRHRNLFYPKNCLECLIGLEKGKRAAGRCMRCYARYKYNLPNSSFRGYLRSYFKKRYWANDERRTKLNQISRIYYINNKERFKKYSIEYAKKNPDKIRLITKRAYWNKKMRLHFESE